MRRTRWTSALAWFAVASVAAWAAGDVVLRHRGWLPSLTPWGALVALGIAGIVLTCGLAVRRLRARERTWMTPTGAAITAAAAQASAHVGAVVGGVYGGQLVLALLSPDSPAMGQHAWSAGGSLVACLIWCIIGFVVEHWCVISDGEDEDGPGGAPSGGAAA
ncbi:DUF3180 domain-containing protein [Actinomyces slackii]|uniref:Protein of uncharacterized function (DUF3180) n=1 Tax=Actinomyces slackii TaxID=52774 RepID=A0A3S5EM57_9ACTO|nr:DUF3180 family protein [Actinomyces slackii]VEG74372.1 Protein of uncharacterised function (DUF3180) [Actinomyces slackii]